MTKLLVSAIAAAGLLIAPANAATIVFKGDGLNATPISGATQVDCGSSGDSNDYCSTGPGVALEYDEGNIDFTVSGFEDFDGAKTGAIVIQDIRPGNSGLGVYSSGEDTEGPDDQVQSRVGESLLFDFANTGKPVTISNIEFNSGADRNCTPSPGGEGPCGLFDLWIDGVLDAANTGVAAVNLLASSFTGTTFEFVARDPANNDNSGWVIAQFDVKEVPIPGALPLLLSGIAGLGFAARRKKTA